MRRIPLPIIVCIVFTCSAALGQEKFMDACVITNEKDTIHGQILSRIDSRLAFEISFRREASGSNITSYSVSDLIGFRFNNGRTFERIALARDKPDTTSVFAKKIVTGKFDLWIWRKPGNAEDFFIRNNGNQKFVHLSQAEEKAASKDGKRYNHRSYKFAGQIKYVTDNEFQPALRKKDLKYSHENINSQISVINRRYHEQIPMDKYDEEIQSTFNLSIGIPIKPESNSTEFRLGVFQRRQRVEKTSNFSTIRGITYYGWHEAGGYDGTIEHGTSNHRWQLFNILPLGVHFQGARRTIRPYVYTGVGLAVLVMSDYEIVDYQNRGTKTSFLPFPTIFVGAGLKLRIGSNYLFAEVTPSVWNSTVSLGFEF